MFYFQREMKKLPIPASRVLRLQGSLGGFQVALPGLACQYATAYVCVYAEKRGCRIAVVFHLKDSQRLAFYLSAEEGIQKEQLGRAYSEGLRFAESMGFLMDDLEFHKKTPAGRKTLWESLPIKDGFSEEEASTSQKVSASPSLPSPETEASKPKRQASRAEMSSTFWPVEAPSQDLASQRTRYLEGLGRFLSSL